MIQRIQSLYLLLVAAVSGILFYLPLFDLPAATSDATSRQFMISSNALLSVLCAATGIGAIIAIFFYRKRPLQMKACRLLLLLTFVLIALLFYTSDTISGGLDRKVVFKAGTYMPMLQVIFIFLAHRGIKKDDELVRSADRLR